MRRQLQSVLGTLEARRLPSCGCATPRTTVSHARWTRSAGVQALRERIRQIERETMAKLRHPSRARPCAITSTRSQKRGTSGPDRPVGLGHYFLRLDRPFGRWPPRAGCWAVRGRVGLSLVAGSDGAGRIGDPLHPRGRGTGRTGESGQLRLSTVWRRRTPETAVRADDGVATDAQLRESPAEAAAPDESPIVATCDGRARCELPGCTGDRVDGLESPRYRRAPPAHDRTPRARAWRHSASTTGMAPAVA